MISSFKILFALLILIETLTSTKTVMRDKLLLDRFLTVLNREDWEFLCELKLLYFFICRSVNCTCVLQTRQGQIRLWVASHYGLRHLSYHGLRPSNLRVLITACEYCEEGLLYSVDTYTFRMMCLPDKA